MLRLKGVGFGLGISIRIPGFEVFIVRCYLTSKWRYQVAGCIYPSGVKGDLWVGDINMGDLTLCLCVCVMRLDKLV